VTASEVAGRVYVVSKWRTGVGPTRIIVGRALLSDSAAHFILCFFLESFCAPILFSSCLFSHRFQAMRSDHSRCGYGSRIL